MNPSFKFYASLTLFVLLLFALAAALVQLVRDLRRSSMWDKLDAGTQEIWVAAWGATIDPDMYQIYHSNNIVGAEELHPDRTKRAGGQ